MAFQDLKNRVEDFTDFSARVGGIYIVARILSAITQVLCMPFSPLVRFIKIYVCFELVQLVISPILVLHKVRLYKQIGTKCVGCGCWVSKDIDCFVCGQHHELSEPVSLEHMDAKTAIANEGMDAYSWMYRKENMTHMMMTLSKLITSTRTYPTLDDKNMLKRLNDFKNVASAYVAWAKFNHVEYTEAAHKDALYSMHGWWNMIIPLYKYFVDNNPKAIIPCPMIIPRHAQTSTRKKYEKIKCPACGGLSTATDPNKSEQIRTCNKCGNKFEYSYLRETMEQQGMLSNFGR